MKVTEQDKLRNRPEHISALARALLMLNQNYYCNLRLFPLEVFKEYFHLHYCYIKEMVAKNHFDFRLKQKVWEDTSQNCPSKGKP